MFITLNRRHRSLPSLLLLGLLLLLLPLLLGSV